MFSPEQGVEQEYEKERACATEVNEAAGRWVALRFFLLVFLGAHLMLSCKGEGKTKVPIDEGSEEVEPKMAPQGLAKDKESPPLIEHLVVPVDHGGNLRFAIGDRGLTLFQFGVGQVCGRSVGVGLGAPVCETIEEGDAFQACGGSWGGALGAVLRSPDGEVSLVRVALPVNEEALLQPAIKVPASIMEGQEPCQVWQQGSVAGAAWLDREGALEVWERAEEWEKKARFEGPFLALDWGLWSGVDGVQLGGRFWKGSGESRRVSCLYWREREGLWEAGEGRGGAHCQLGEGGFLSLGDGEEKTLLRCPLDAASPCVTLGALLERAWEPPIQRLEGGLILLSPARIEDPTERVIALVDEREPSKVLYSLYGVVAASIHPLGEGQGIVAYLKRGEEFSLVVETIGW